MKTYRVGRYLLSFEESVRHEPYDEGYVTGVKFWHEGMVFDAHCHEFIGERIHVGKTSEQGYSRDIPLNPNSVSVMPFPVSLSYAGIGDGKSTFGEQVSAPGGDGPSPEDRYS